MLDSELGGEVLKDEMVTNGTFLGSAIYFNGLRPTAGHAKRAAS